MRRAAILLAAFALAACTKPVSPGVTELVFATPYSPGHPFSRADKAWMAFVEARSGGRLKIRPIWSGALLSSDQSMTELRHGVADIGLVTPIYARGGAHFLRTQAGYYRGAKSIESQVELYRCMAAQRPEFANELGGLHILAVQGGNLPGLLTRDRPIRSLADLKGLRIRAPSELLPILRELGADPVNMPMGEVYSALAKGVIDGVVAPSDTFRSLHFAEVAKHYVALDVPRGAYPARAMGVRRWNRLSEADRIVLTEAIPVWEAALAQEMRKEIDTGLAFGTAGGIQITTLSDEDRAAFERLYDRNADELAASTQRYGIDGAPALRIARASIGADGSIACKGAS